MKEQITIKVDRPTNNPQKSFITVFERIVDSDTSISVPYQTLVDALRFVFGNSSVISVSSSCV